MRLFKSNRPFFEAKGASVGQAVVASYLPLNILQGTAGKLGTELRTDS